MRHPDFDELVGTDVPERDRLQDVHELLIAAGPPPELPPSLQHPPGRERDESVRVLRSSYPRRRLVAAVALAVVVALAAFGGGYLVGDRESTDAAAQTVKLVGTDSAQGAVASVRIFAADDAGNHAIELTVRGLAELPARGYYVLGMTQKGELAATCGFFKVEGDKTEVKLNASYDVTRFDGWAIVAHLPGDPGSSDELLLTSA